MIIVDPVVLGDVPFMRPSPKWVYDRTGTLVEVPANTLGVTYDPADLSKAPWALLEPEATNRIRNNSMIGAVIGGIGNGGALPTNWILSMSVIGLAAAVTGVGIEDGLNYVDVRIAGTATARGNISIFPDGFDYSSAAAQGQAWVSSVFIRLVAGSNSGVESHYLVIEEYNGNVYMAGQGYERPPPSELPLRMQRVDRKRELAAAVMTKAGGYIGATIPNGANVDFTLRIALPQFERDRLSSPIKTSNGAFTRAADVVGAGAGLVYSNVPMVELPYNVATTYAKDAAVYDPATKIVYWSMVAGNVGKALSDPAFWNKRTAINRWAMFDDRNSTQTSNSEEIVSVFSAQAITQGLFAGAMDASEVRVSMTHPTRGLVHSETKSLVLPRSGSSFYGWCFNRLRLRTWFLTLKLPVFANALVTVTIKKPGGAPKCGMCLLGPTVDVGLSLMGLSTELKDYSTTTFFTDGSSSTVERGFSKKMSVDISVESDRVETIEDDLIKRRQKTLVFLGSTMRGDTMLVGRFSSLRKVIDSFPRSKMALQIDGVLSQ
ncbi:hypothetical protein RCH14_000384 [Massilia sp. MP_M2]|uniref:hypothetical protein n=1 Tax=Massilia sp. MP_M2 TaxID=3071713 RepID=UPI00319E4648